MTLHVPDIDPEAGVIAAALAYAEAGWYVLPVDPGTKHAGSVLGKGWPAKSSRDPEQLVDWFMLEPHALALHMGRSGAVAFDVDDPTALPAVLVDALGTTEAPHQSTRTDVPGRGHHLFAMPDGKMFGNSSAGLGGGAWGDVRGKNGIIIVSPSEHAKAAAGGRYQWVRTGPVPELPDTLADRLRDASESADAATDPEVAAFLTEHTGAARPQLLKALTQRFVADVRAGRSRHESMLLPAVNAMRESRAGLYPAHQAAEALLGLFIDATARSRDGTERTLSPSQARAEFHGILAWAIAQARTAAPAEMQTVTDGITERAPERSAADLIAPNPTNTPTIDVDGSLATVHDLTPDQVADAEEARRLAHERLVAEEIQKLEVREEARRRMRAKQRPAEAPKLSILADFLSVEDPPQRYRIDGLWPLGGRVMLAAQFKAGKTTLVGNLVRSLVDGEAFLDSFTVDPLPEGCRVVVIDDELDERMIRSWMRDQNIRNTSDAAVLALRGNLSSFDILDPTVRSQWAAALREAGAEVVVLDCLAPLIDALGLSEDKEAGQLLVAFDELLGEAGASEAVVVHHMGHSGERTRGASRLRDWPDVEWRLVREKGTDGENAPDAPRYFSAYGRDVDVKESALSFDPLTRRLSLTGGTRAGAKLRDAREAIIELLTVRPHLSGRSITDELADEFTQKDVRAALKQAVNEGQVLTAPGPRRAVLHRVTECVTALQDSTGTNTISAGQPQCVSASEGIGLVEEAGNPVRQTSNTLKTPGHRLSASVR